MYVHKHNLARLILALNEGGDGDGGGSGGGTDGAPNPGNGSGDGDGSGGDGSKSIESLLAGLDEDDRKTVLAELTRARNDAGKYRKRAKNAFESTEEFERAKTALVKLDEIENAAKSEAQRERDARTAAEKARDDARTELLRERVGRRHKLPDPFVELLRGTDEDAMNDHAEALASELEKARARPGQAVPPTSRPGGAPSGGDGEQFDPVKIAEAALRGL